MAQILIVEDDPSSSSFFRALCRTLGHEVKVAATLESGLHGAQSESPDLILLDVHLPDGNGLESLPQFRLAETSPVVIIVTGLGDANGAEMAIKSGAWDYLQKPVPPQEFTLTVTRALEFRQVERSRRTMRALKREALVGESPPLMTCLDLVAKAADSDMSVLLAGETGTGKEVVAQIIHQNSARAAHPFVVVDCSSLPENLVESVLFGHTKGAFTGAAEDRVGLVKKADGGTLFLDEIGEMPLASQKNLLRVLQERTFRPVGSAQEVSSNFRLIAATNRNLEQMVQQKAFRDDLLYRLKTLQIHLPPLRERKEDCHLLMIHFMKSFHLKYGHGLKGIGSDLLEVVENYGWPGNVRELKSALEYAYLMAAYFPTLLAQHLPAEIRIHRLRETLGRNEADPNIHWIPFSLPQPLEEFRQEAERKYFQFLVAHSKGVAKEAAQIAGLSLPRLYALLRETGVSLRAKNSAAEDALPEADG